MYNWLARATALIDVTEDNGLSSVVDLQGYQVIGLILPTLDSCNLTFQVCDEPAGTFRALKGKDGNAITITATTGGFAVSSSDLAPLLGYRYVKVATSQVQTKDRSFIFSLKG